MPPSEKYRRNLVRFLSFLNKTKYCEKQEFNNERILQITPEDIFSYFNYRAYGVQYPSAEARPTNARSTTIQYQKNAISQFMRRKFFPWDDINRIGNPSKSIQVNNLIKLIKKHGVRKEGSKSKVVRPLEFNELVNILDIVSKSDKIPLKEKFRLSSKLAMQWQLIGRIDEEWQRKI